MRKFQGNVRAGVMLAAVLMSMPGYAQFYERPLLQKGVTGTDQEPVGNRNLTGPAKVANPPGSLRRV